MTEPLAPQDPPPPTAQQVGDRIPEHNVSADHVVPMGGNVANYSDPSGNGVGRAGPFSDIVGRPVTSDETT